MIFKKFLRSRSGNFGMMSAILMVPIAGAAGLAIDFSEAYSVRTSLNNAADAAAVGSVAEKSVAVREAMLMQGDGPIDDGAKDARALFMGQAGSDVSSLSVNLNTSVVKNGNKVTSKVTYSAVVPTTFSQLLGQKTITVSGVATAEYQTSAFMDFYILIDNTPSMGLGATSADINLLKSKTTDTCAFACHNMDATTAKPSYYSIAKKFNITMRIDVVRQATQALTQTATNSRASDNQFRMAVYSFGQKAETAGLLKVAPLTSDLTAVNNAIATDPNDPTKGIDLMTIPKQGWNSDQTTDLVGTLTSMAQEIPAAGNGASAASPEKILFFVSDGVADAARVACTRKKVSQNRCIEPIDQTLCQPLKARGVKIAILYTTYLPLPENSFYNSWVSPFQPQIGSYMQNCATPGLYFEVSPTQGISDAMKALFLKAINMPRLTS
ncbi:TadE/TadG family type IV pilus assembly protein [Oryzifoliimicrobium ureilyticus]|uniref:TadE/TadG family type IV pilus assembly protein n=1 Tax=Oryzifoliimicrobium ureilyticus TaxID=3113724 RepID=UPI0030766A61